MSLYVETLKVFLKNKMLWITIVLFNAYHMLQLVISAYPFEANLTLLDDTRAILYLSPQFLILYLIITYEFSSQKYRNNMSESILSTDKGKRTNIQLIESGVVATFLLINFVVMTLLNLGLTDFSCSAMGIEKLNIKAIDYICKTMFVNIGLIGLIGILCGILFSAIKKRICGYTAIMTVVFITSYLLNEIAAMVMVYSNNTINMYNLFDIFNIMTSGLNFMPNVAIGYPLSTYKIALILFWIILLLLGIEIVYRRNKAYGKKVCLCILCIICLTIYAMPASRVDMGLSSSSSAMADQYYYDIGEYRVDECDSDFDVTQYIMDLDVDRLLKATVTLKVSECLPEYKFTLSHSYNVKCVLDETGRNLKFSREGDTLIVYCPNESKCFTVEYTGANEAYYANSQGVNLRGSFPYYPIAGFHQISEDGFYMNPLFLEKETDFDIRVNCDIKIFSNLPEVAKQHFVGKTKGPTLIGGLYDSYECYGIQVVYPFFSTWTEDNLNKVAKAASEFSPNSKVFITPNMNREDDAVNKEQIITRNYFESVYDLEPNLNKED